MKYIIYITSFLLALFAVLYPELAIADIRKPDFVSDNGVEKLDEAGQTLYTYISYGFGIALGIAAAVISFLALQGKMSEMWEKAGNIIVGVLMFLLFGTIVFAFI